MTGRLTPPNLVGLQRENRKRAALPAKRQAVAEALRVLGDQCPPHLVAVAQATIDHPDASAAELAELLGFESKYIVQGRIRRLIARAQAHAAGRPFPPYVAPGTSKRKRPRGVPNVLPAAEVERLRRLVGAA